MLCLRIFFIKMCYPNLECYSILVIMWYNIKTDSERCNYLVNIEVYNPPGRMYHDDITERNDRLAADPTRN